MAHSSKEDLMKLLKKLRQEKPAPSSHLLLNNYPTNSRFAEAYRTLRTNILFSFMEKKFRSLLITSAGQAEGKTNAVANLAYTTAQAGRSVLMIDADLRKPTLTKLISSQESPGLTGLLSNLFGTDIGSGSLERFGISDLLRLLSLQKKTGLLRLSDGKEKVELFFFQGEPADLNWLTRPEKKKLAALLINNGTLAEEHVTSAIARQKDTGQKLGSILINMGLLQEADLKGPLSIHMMEGLRVALQMNKGEFYFKELPESDFDRSSFDPVDFHRLYKQPVDFHRLYKQMVLGKEELPYLQEEINSAILKTGEPNLFLLPSGNLPPNPSELLGSKRMSFLLSNLKKRFDVLIIDSAPILPASDALVLAPEADGVLLMVKAGLINRQMVKKAVEQLRVAQANLLGVALNHVDIKREGYYKYYHKYYSQYYGEGA